MSSAAHFTLLFSLGLPAAITAAELKPQTLAAFDQYGRITEGQHDTELTNATSFLRIDNLDAARRGIPMGLGWRIGPFVTSIPRDSLEFALETTRRALAR